MQAVLGWEIAAFIVSIGLLIFLVNKWLIKDKDM